MQTILHKKFESHTLSTTTVTSPANNHPLFLVPQNYSYTLAITEHTSQGRSYPQSPVSHIGLHNSTIDDTY